MSDQTELKRLKAARDAAWEAERAARVAAWAAARAAWVAAWEADAAYEALVAREARKAVGVK